MDSAIDAVLSTSSDSGGDDDSLAASGRKARKRQSRLKPKPASADQTSQARDRYQAGEAVEARFGGRSKWFPGKVRRAYEEQPKDTVVYDIEYDDGDKEEGVVAGRVRRPGQSAPTLETGTTVDVKLARKGKGYHAGKIGRLNDDGSFYVKLDDGDSEWSVPAKQVIPAYPFAAATSAPDQEGSSPGSHSRQPPSATNEEDSPRSSAVVNSAPSKEGEAAETTNEPLSAPPPGEQQQNDDLIETRSEDAGDGDGGGGGGVSWIAELASSVGVLPAGEKAPVPDSAAERDKQPDDANGLGWIAEVVSHVEGGPSTTRSTAGVAGSAASPSPHPAGGGSAATRSTAPEPIAAGDAPSARPGAPAPAPNSMSPTPVAGGGGVDRGHATPGTTKSKPPRAQTPNHLTWKPITDGTASRPWGAPPPEEDQDKTTEGNSSKGKQDMLSPPRLWRSVRAPEPSSSSSHPPGRQDPVATADGGGSGTAANNEPPKEKLPPSSGGSSCQESESGTRLPPGGRDPTLGAAAPKADEPRYAAEAVHLAEEVRLLAAKLKAADDRAHARLAQQERQFVDQMEEMLQRERAKMQAQLAEERASNARRVGALQKELDTARRQLELERDRTAKGAARELLQGRRARTPPPLGHATTIHRLATPEASTRRGRHNSRQENTPHFSRYGHPPGPATATMSRRRSASGSAPARGAPSTGLEKSEQRHPPPPPPPTGTRSPGKGFAISAATSSWLYSTSDRLGVSGLSGGDFPLPLTPAATAGAGGALDAVEGTTELAAVKGGGTNAEAAADSLPESSRRSCEERLRWKLETERRDTRKRLEAMKGEVERVLGQFRSRTERAEAAAASAEKRATLKALRYLRSKQPQLLLKGNPPARSRHPHLSGVIRMSPPDSEFFFSG
eukprot:g15900.t1